MTPVIGIDLGTTNTVVAVVRDGQVSAIADETGQALIPSVVSFHPSGTVLVGQAAKIRRLVDATNTIYSVKRLIGRSWQSDEVREARTRFPFEMREGPGQAALVVGRGETYTLPEISAFVLRKAKSVAESFLRQPVERAVITVPANFNDLQRAATKVAGRVAGLEVLRILNEPTAAALAYGFGKDTAERLAVYDFGGGTFDVTLLDLSDNVFEVLATAGNTFLGGDDIDLVIADRMADEFLARHRSDPRADPQTFERIRAAAEHIKLRLSYENEASVSMDEIAHGPQGRALSLEFHMDRAAFERLASPIIDRTFDVCREALELARSGAEDFDHVLLVGGSTRVPLVRQRVEEFFGRELRANLSPDEVVALGAAIQANALTGMERRRAAIPVPPAVGHGSNTEVRAPAASVRTRTPTLQGVPVPAEAPLQSVRKEESVAFALSDNDLEDIAEGSLADEHPHSPEPYWLDSPALDYPEDEITAAGRGTNETTDDEPTRVGIRVPPALPPLPEPARAGAAFSAPAFSDFGALREIPEAPSAPPPSARPAPSIPPGRSLPPLAATLSSRSPASPIAAQTPFHGAPITSELPPPLLVDVTPLTLSVETVSGFCDAIIGRNTPVPCEETREFVTASDGQTSVRVRVAQGESRRFDENTLLGEVELSGLASAPRGAVQIAVTFGLDANGMLNVSALDKQTGRATNVQLRLLGMPDAIQLAAMIERHASRLPH